MNTALDAARARDDLAAARASDAANAADRTHARASDAANAARRTYARACDAFDTYARALAALDTLEANPNQPKG